MVTMLVILYLLGSILAHLGAKEFAENHSGINNPEDYIMVYFVAPLLSWVAVYINEKG